MDNNVFFKNKLKNSKKFNPDVKFNMKKKRMIRDNLTFKPQKKFYNSITNVIPDKVKSGEDLRLKQDTSDININKLISERKSQRSIQNNVFRDYQKGNKRTKSNQMEYNPNNFQDLRRGQQQYQNKITQKRKKEQTNMDDIMDGLKELGIIT